MWLIAISAMSSNGGQRVFKRSARI